MPYSRRIAPGPAPGDDALTAALVGIGFNLSAPAGTVEPNIEDTLLFASVAAMEHDDLRMLTLLVTWFGLHSSWTLADRMTRIVAEQSSARVRALWAALAQWQRRDRRFARMADSYRGRRIDATGLSSSFLLQRHGEDPRFADTPLRVAANVLRDRPSDVLTPRELARRHRAYRRRVMIGPTYRADMWAALEKNHRLSAAELARRTYGSFPTAWHVKREYDLLRPGEPRP